MDSHLAKFLTNNDPPSEEMISEVQDLLVGPLKELAKTESEVNGLLARLNQLNAKRDELKQSMDEYRTIISPIRRLTDDSLREIFLHCLVSHRNPTMNASEAPVLLTRVCRRWRSVALSSPRLWAQIQITFCDDYRCSVSPQFPNGGIEGDQNNERRLRAHGVLTQRLQAVNKWLVRSGTCPLSISIYYSSSPWNYGGFFSNEMDDEQDLTVQLFRIITSFAHRLKSLQLTMAVEIYRILDAMLSLDSLTMLTAFKANFHHQLPTPGEPRSEPIGLFEAPYLERLSLIGFSAHPLWGTTSVPFADKGQHLTYFSSHISFTVVEALSLLKQCRNLIHCRLWLVRDYESMPLSAVTCDVFLPSLWSLSVLDDNSDHVSATQFYSTIHAPHLRWIEYLNQPPSDFDDGNTPPFISLLQKCTELQKLTIDPWCFRQRGLRTTLELVSPTLTHLVLGDEPKLRFPNDVHARDHDSAQRSAPPFDVDFLIVDQEFGPESEIVLPHLEIFESTAFMIPDKTILQIITSRMCFTFSHGCSTLKRVRLWLNRSKQIDIRQEVAQCQAAVIAENRPQPAGVKLDLHYNGNPFDTTPDHLSLSYGLDHFGRSWGHLDLDELLIEE